MAAAPQGQVSAAEQRVHWSCHSLITAELVVPSTIVVLRAENRRGLLPTDVEKLQNIMLLYLCRLQKEPFVQNEKLGMGVFHQDLL